MKASILCILALVAVSGVCAERKLLQLPTLPDATSGTPTPAPAPAPGPLGACALDYLLNTGNFNTLVELLGAASRSTDISQLLASPSSAITLLAPTDAGIQRTLGSLGLTIQQILADPNRITDILLYHVLPSQIQASDLVDGYAFNTQLTTNQTAQSIGVRGNGNTATFVGRSSQAAATGSPATACNINIIPIDGLLVP